MKKFYIFSVVLPALLLAGCKIDNGESFEPGRLGYNMAVNAMAGLHVSVVELNMLRHLDEYISAGDEERVQIQDRYFYSQRIVERGNNEWNIIGGYSEDMVVLTGGKSLSEKGTRWEYYYSRYEYETDNLPWVENVTDGEHAKFAVYSRGDFRYYTSEVVINAIISCIPHEQTSTDGSIVTREYADIESVAGKRMSACLYYYFYDDTEFDFTIESTLRYDLEKYMTHYGRLAFSIQIDDTHCTPVAEFKDNVVTVWGGKDNAYREDYRFYPRY